MNITNLNICDRLCFQMVATLSLIPHALLQCDFVASLSTVESILPLKMKYLSHSLITIRLQQKWYVCLSKLSEKKPCSFFGVLVLGTHAIWMLLPRMLPLGSCHVVSSLGHAKRSHADIPVNTPSRARPPHHPSPDSRRVRRRKQRDI